MNKTSSLITHYQKETFPKFTQIQQILQERNISLNHVVIDYEDIDSSIKTVKECARNSSFLIADIFASFYLRYETNSNAKILFNPIMKPSDFSYLKRRGLFDRVVEMEKFIDEYRDAEIRYTTYAVFEHSTLKDPSFDANLFMEQYGRKFNKEIDNFCFADRVTGLNKALDYFDKIQEKSKNQIEI